MSSIQRQRIIIRRFKYLANHVIKNEPIKKRTISIPPIHPSQVRTGRNFVRLGGIICDPIQEHTTNKSLDFENLKRLFYLKHPNGDDDKDKSDQQIQRDQEVKKLQELRRRSIEHIYDQESVWKAMKERDELLRRDRDDKDRKEEKPNDDENK